MINSTQFANAFKQAVDHLMNAVASVDTDRRSFLTGASRAAGCACAAADTPEEKYLAEQLLTMVTVTRKETR